METSPLGHQRPDPGSGQVPAYHFWMLLHEEQNPTPLIIAGGIGVRIGRNRNIQMYAGNIGYHVYPPARGHHYAERACRLVLPLIKRHGIDPVWITCNPDNVASRNTIERLGAELVEIVDIPEDHEFYQRGERQKCRYRLFV